MNFAKALEALKEGKMVRRHMWSSNQKFVFMQVPSIVKKEVVPKMTSLPEAVKKEFMRLLNDPSFQQAEIYYSDQLAMVQSSLLITGYSPTVSDCLANDWVEVNYVSTQTE